MTCTSGRSPAAFRPSPRTSSPNPAQTTISCSTTSKRCFATASSLTHSTLQIDRDHTQLLQIHSPTCPQNPANRATPSEPEEAQR